MRLPATLPLAILAAAASALAQPGVITPRQSPADASLSRYRSLELVGRVGLANGGSPSEQAGILLTCMGRRELVAVTDRLGRFRFQFDPQVLDRSVCTLTAELEGFESSKVSIPSLAGEQGSVSLGTITLHGDGPGIVSATSADAPKSARKNLERARKILARNKPNLPEAEAALQAAVAEYDRYAEAWLELGNVLAQLERPLEALDAYGKCIEADPAYVPAYRPAIQFARQQEAKDLFVLWCKDAIRVDPTLRDACAQ